MYTSRNRRVHAFTLLEIMLVVMIIAILAGAAIHLLGDGPLKTSGQVVAVSNAQTIKSVLVQYQTFSGRLPTTEQGLDALVTKPTIEPVPRRWTQLMEKTPLDPWQNQFVYRNPGKRKPTGYDLFSAGADGKPDTEDDVYPD
jgi:general secretion pathway protein G